MILKAEGTRVNKFIKTCGLAEEAEANKKLRDIFDNSVLSSGKLSIYDLISIANLCKTQN